MKITNQPVAFWPTTLAVAVTASGVCASEGMYAAFNRNNGNGANHVPYMTRNKKLISRSCFKTSDQVTGKAQTDEKAEHIFNICEHFEEGCNAAIGPQMGF